MNGFDEMAIQFQMETFVKKMDALIPGKVDDEIAFKVLAELDDALNLMKAIEDMHPLEYGVFELIRSAYAIYVLSNLGSPTALALLAKQLIPAAIKFNEEVHPWLVDMHKKAGGKAHG